MSSCLECGVQCTGRWCSECEAEQTAPDLTHPDGEKPECPTCGGRTSGDGVVCAQCRRVDDIVGDFPDDGGDSDSQLESAVLEVSD
jgi:hypothetical protein